MSEMHFTFKQWQKATLETSNEVPDVLIGFSCSKEEIQEIIMFTIGYFHGRLNANKEDKNES